MKRSLPEGWSEHTTADGRMYYYNAASQQSTWDVPSDEVEKKDVKEKAVKTKPIKGTKWRVVFTDGGHHFFNNVETKASSWSVPSELVGYLNVMTDEEKKALFSPEDHEIPVKRYRQAQKEIEPESEEDSFNLTLEERSKLFTSLLYEQNVSPFNTWESELMKIHTDSRFKLVRGKKNRKALFESYCKAVLAIKNKEKEEQRQKAQAEFEKLLDSCTSKSSWQSINEILKQLNYQKYLNMKECEALVKSRIKELIHEEDLEKVKQKQQCFDEFMNLLSESDCICEKSQWKDVKKVIENDPRYLAVANWKDREEFFELYKRNHRDSIGNNQSKMTRNSCFLLLLKEKITSHRNASVQGCKTILESDERYFKEGLSKSEKQELVENHIDELYSKCKESCLQAMQECCLSFKTSFEEVSSIILANKTILEFEANASRIQKIFKDLQRQRAEKAKEDLFSLLKARNIKQESDLDEELTTHQCFSIWNEEERKEIIMDYLNKHS